MSIRVLISKLHIALPVVHHFKQTFRLTIYISAIFAAALILRSDNFPYHCYNRTPEEKPGRCFCLYKWYHMLLL